MGTLGELVGKKTHTLPSAHEAFVLPWAKIGIEVEAEEVRSVEDLDESLWQTKADHSLHNKGCEFVTVDGLVGNTLYSAIEHICAFAKKKKYSEGYPRAGIHIHLDVTDLNVEKGELLRLVTNYLIVEHLMFQFAGDWRKHCCYCYPFYLGKNDFDVLGRVLTANDMSSDGKYRTRDLIMHLSKYQALNLRPLVDLGTIEFRALPTTFDIERLLLWINMILSIKKSATDKEFAEPLKLLSHVGPELFVERIFGQEILRKANVKIDERAIWTAVDNVATLVALGREIGLHPKAKKSASLKNLSPIMTKRLEALQKSKKLNGQFLLPDDVEKKAIEIEKKLSTKFDDNIWVIPENLNDPLVRNWTNLTYGYWLQQWLIDPNTAIGEGLMTRILALRQSQEQDMLGELDVREEGRAVEMGVQQDAVGANAIDPVLWRIVNERNNTPVFRINPRAQQAIRDTEAFPMPPQAAPRNPRR